MAQTVGIVITSIAALLFIGFGILSIIHPKRTNDWGKFKVMPFLYSPATFLNKILGIESQPLKYQSTTTKNELIAARVVGVLAILCGLLCLFIAISISLALIINRPKLY
jgi:hypothetical protein